MRANVRKESLFQLSDDESRSVVDESTEDQSEVVGVNSQEFADFGDESYGDSVSPRKNSTPQYEAFKEIYDRAFYSDITRRCSNIKLAEATFNTIRFLAGKYPTHWKIVCESPEFQQFYGANFHQFFKQWKSAWNENEKIAIIFSLQDFVKQVAEYCDEQNSFGEAHHNADNSLVTQSYDMEADDFSIEINEMIETFIPEMRMLPIHQDPSTLRIRWGINKSSIAYFKLGQLRACMDQALFQLGTQMGRPGLFAQSIPLKLYPDQIAGVLLQDERSDFASTERFYKSKGESEIIIGLKTISYRRLLNEARKPRKEQNFLLGSFQPNYPHVSNKFYVQEYEELLMSLSVSMILHLRDIKAEDMSQVTMLDAETPLIPGNQQENLPKIYLNILGEVFARKPSQEDWQTLCDFLSELDGEKLGNFLGNLDSTELDGALVNEMIKYPEEKKSLYYGKPIHRKEQPELYCYSQLKFSPHKLFSETQVHLFKDNVKSMQQIVKTLASRPAESTASILQLVLAFDPLWVNRFVTFKLFREASEDLTKALFKVDKKLDEPTVRKNLKESCDKSPQHAGSPDHQLPFPILSGNLLSAEQMAECQKCLSYSLSEEDLQVILKQPKKAEEKLNKPMRTSPSILRGFFAPKPKAAENGSSVKENGAEEVRRRNRTPEIDRSDNKTPSFAKAE
jgi:hypothetical protein